MEEIFKAEDVSYSYKDKSGTLKGLRKASGTFYSGKVYAITGSPGSGKSTLMSLLAGFDAPGEGLIYLKGVPLNTINQNYYRSHNVGIVFQKFSLLPHLTALENVILSLEFCSWPLKGQRPRALELLDIVGIDITKAGVKTAKLTPDEQLRVAIARSIGPNPQAILADEPADNLDCKTADPILKLLIKLSHEENYCVIIATSKSNVAKFADEVWGMKEGVLLPLKTD